MIKLLLVCCIIFSLTSFAGHISRGGDPISLKERESIYHYLKEYCYFALEGYKALSFLVEKKKITINKDHIESSIKSLMTMCLVERGRFSLNYQLQETMNNFDDGRIEMNPVLWDEVYENNPEDYFHIYQALSVHENEGLLHNEGDQDYDPLSINIMIHKDYIEGIRKSDRCNTLYICKLDLTPLHMFKKHGIPVSNYNIKILGENDNWDEPKDGDIELEINVNFKLTSGLFEWIFVPEGYSRVTDTLIYSVKVIERQPSADRINTMYSKTWEMKAKDSDAKKEKKLDEEFMGALKFISTNYTRFRFVDSDSLPSNKMFETERIREMQKGVDACVDQHDN